MNIAIAFPALIVPNSKKIRIQLGNFNRCHIFNSLLLIQELYKEFDVAMIHYPLLDERVVDNEAELSIRAINNKLIKEMISYSLYVSSSIFL